MTRGWLVNQAELYNAVIPEDRQMTCWGGCGEVEPVLEMQWVVENGKPQLAVTGRCPKCGLAIRQARQIHRGSLESLPW